MRTAIIIATIVATIALIYQLCKSRTTDSTNKATMQEAGEAIARKNRSLARLKSEGVPSISHLPLIEDSTEAKQRTPDEIAKRAIAICLTAVKGEGLEQATVDKLVQKYRADTFFSPEEAAFIKDQNPSKEARIKFSWRYECYWVLLWSLGYIEKLESPNSPCDVAKAVSIFHDRGVEKFISEAKPRSIHEILDESDLAYRYHWAAVNARLKNEASPANLDPGVVMERHYALNWLIGYMGQEWDEISTDT